MSAPTPVRESLNLVDWVGGSEGKVDPSLEWGTLLAARIAYRLGQLGRIVPPPREVVFEITLPLVLERFFESCSQCLLRLFSGTVTSKVSRRRAEEIDFELHLTLPSGRTFFDPPAIPANGGACPKPFAGEE